MKEITSEKAYNKALADVYKIMQKGENNLIEKDGVSIATMSKSIQEYEKIHYPFPMPKTIGEIVDLNI